jgi:hypothetical protein
MSWIYTTITDGGIFSRQTRKRHGTDFRRMIHGRISILKKAARQGKNLNSGVEYIHKRATLIKEVDNETRDIWI